MPDLLHRLAEAVATHLNEAELSPGYTAAVRYMPSFELRELAELQVSVTPRAIVREVDTRHSDRMEAAVDIAVMQQCGPEDMTRLAELMGLTADLQDHVNRRVIAEVGAVWIRSERDPVFSAEALAEQRVFLAVLTVIYRMAA